jgi:hypothetical protein
MVTQRFPTRIIRGSPAPFALSAIAERFLTLSRLRFFITLLHFFTAVLSAFGAPQRSVRQTVDEAIFLYHPRMTDGGLPEPISMRLPLTTSESIDLTTIITHRRLSHLCLLLQVRLGGYIVNLCDFYSYRLIGKPTAFLQLQEFSLRKPTVASSTSTARRSLHSSKQGLAWLSLRLQLYVLHLI